MSIFAGEDPFWVAKRGTVTNGLVGHWDSMVMSAADRAGNRWLDISGNNNHGTLIGGASFDRIGCNFDGVNDLVKFSNSGCGNLGASDTSICFWVKLPNIAAMKSIITKRLDQPDYRQWNITQGNVTTVGGGQSGKHIGLFWTNGGNPVDSTNHSQIFRTTNDVVDGNWHHVIITRTNSTVPKIYIDGLQVAVTAIVNGTTNINADNNDFLRFAAANDSIVGEMGLDDIRIYNRALSATEISRNFNATRARFGV
jgi:hypothetical protein